MNDEHGRLDYNYITDGIFIGTNQCCSTHFEESLIRDGVTTDISLEEERLDQPFGVEWYVWIPVKDHTAPSMEQLVFGADALLATVKLGKKVYVHCKNGHGRAPTLVAAYLIKKGMALEEAEQFLKQKRPVAHIETPQKQALIKFSKRL